MSPYSTDVYMIQRAPIPLMSISLCSRCVFVFITKDANGGRVCSNH